jgi:hypothetical protein
MPAHSQHYDSEEPSLQVAEGLRTLISGLYDKHLAADGRGVDYASLAHDVGFRDYITASAELTKVCLSGIQLCLHSKLGWDKAPCKMRPHHI